MNALIEQSSKAYHQRMQRWIDIALEEGVRFFVTSLGNPRWVVDRVTAVGGVVYHDVTERRWAEKGLAGGVHGLIGVNNLAGGHAGPHSPEALLAEVGNLGVPVVCAGGVGTERDFARALAIRPQAGGSTPADRQRFEVTSIKRNVSGDQNLGLNLRAILEFDLRGRPQYLVDDGVQPLKEVI